MILILSLAGGSAHADYECINRQTDQKLKVLEKYDTRVSNALAILTSSAGKFRYYGSFDLAEGAQKRKVMKIYPYNNDSFSLTIVTRPFSCGRGSCDENGLQTISAYLKIRDSETFFSCEYLENAPNP